MSAEAEVRKASEQFYAALTRMANGETGSMKGIWLHSPDVTAMHPIGGRDDGWDEVGHSFDQVAELASPGGQIRLVDQRIQVAGDFAFEVGTEEGQVSLGGHEVPISWRVTNIYRQEAGAWKIVHHHTDASPAMQDVLKRLAG